nr:hypothetical protein HK105_000893 [Polyrhizophydium stewartii]
MAAGPLTMLTSGLVADADVNRLSWGAKTQMWIDAFELDWAGDLGRLSSKVMVPARGFWAIRSRGMYERVRALRGWQHKHGLAHAAARNGWADLLDFEHTLELSLVACECGAMWLLDRLASDRVRPLLLRPKHVISAIAYGQLRTVVWLHQRMPDGEWGAVAMDKAASFGEIQILDFLRCNRTEGCTQAAIDGAAGNGHIAVIEYLLAHGLVTVQPSTVCAAAAAGRIGVLEWLTANGFSAAFTPQAMDAAAGSGIAVLEWFRTNRAEGCTPHALVTAAGAGAADVVAWLLTNVSGVEWDVQEAALAAESSIAGDKPLAVLRQYAAMQGIQLVSMSDAMNEAFNDVGDSDAEMAG